MSDLPTNRAYPPTLALRALEIARSKIGEAEYPPRSNQGPIVDWALKGLGRGGQAVRWCAFFVSQCYLQAAQTTAQVAQVRQLCSGSVDYLWVLLSARGWTWVRAGDSTAPEPGDLVFFGSSEDLTHVGLVEQLVDEGLVYISGNAGPQSDRVAAQQSQDPARIYGYARISV